MTPIFLRLSLGQPLSLADLWSFVDVFSAPWNATERDVVVRTIDGQPVALEVAFDAKELHTVSASACESCRPGIQAATRVDPLSRPE